VAGVIKREEESFLATIDGGLERIERLFALGIVGAGSWRAARRPNSTPPTASRRSLLETLAAERNCGFDWDGFREAMDEHGQGRAPAAGWRCSPPGPLDALKKTMHGSEFLGYETLAPMAR
jgi:alanyl-tRNA synthetase